MNNPKSISAYNKKNPPIEVVKEPKKRNYLEDELHIMIIDWCKLYEKKYPVLKYLFHAPNGGSRNAIEGARFKRMGVKRGVPDLLLLVPNDEFIGLAMELKAPKGKMSDDQNEFKVFLESQGFYYETVYSFERATKIIEWYLGNKE